MSRMPATRRLAASLLSLPVLAALLAPLSARAQPIDLNQATCADFAGMSDADRGQLALWLAGFYAGAAQRPLLDVSRIAAAPAELLAICSKSPQLPLIGAEARQPFAAPAP